MKFEFNIQIINQSNSTYKGKLKFLPSDYQLVEHSEAYKKEIYEYFEILPNTSSKWFKTDIETKPSFDPRTFRSDIHLRSTIELNLEEPKSMVATGAMEANATGKCYAFFEISADNQISIRCNDQPVVDESKPSYEAWTREY